MDLTPCRVESQRVKRDLAVCTDQSPLTPRSCDQDPPTASTLSYLPVKKIDNLLENYDNVAYCTETIVSSSHHLMVQ